MTGGLARSGRVRCRAVALDFGGSLSAPVIDHLLGEKPVDPDAARALHELHDLGLVLVLGSNTLPGERRWPALQAAGVHRLFRAAILSYPLGVSKPDPLFYELVATAAGCPPGQVLFAGDSFPNDVIGADHAGMRTALIRHGGLLRPGEDERLPAATRIISHVRELPALAGPALAGELT